MSFPETATYRPLRLVATPHRPVEQKLAVCSRARSAVSVTAGVSAGPRARLASCRVESGVPSDDRRHLVERAGEEVMQQGRETFGRGQRLQDDQQCLVEQIRAPAKSVWETTPQPAARSPQPAARSPQPAARSPQPAARSPQPAARSPQPAARSPQPAARSPQPAARSPQPAARSPQPAARSPQPAARSPQPAARSPQPAARSPQPAARSPQPAARSPQPAARSPQPAARSPQPGRLAMAWWGSSGTR